MKHSDPKKTRSWRERPHRTHFRTPRIASPFQPRIEALMQTEEWYDWAGYKAPIRFGTKNSNISPFAARPRCSIFRRW